MSRLGRVDEAVGPRRFKPYPEYKASGIEWLGEIPADWQIKRLKRVFRVVSGATPASTEIAFWNGEIPWVTPEDLGVLDGATIRATTRSLTEAGYRSCGTTMVPAGSLVLSTRAPIGHVAMAGVELCTNQGCRSLVFREAVSATYYYYELLAARPELQAHGQGSTFQELGKGKLEDFTLVVPNVTVDRAIAAFLDRETARIDGLVEKNRRLIELLQERRTALITQAVTKGLDPAVPMKDSGVEWLGEVPAHWEVKRLKTFASVELSNVDKKSVDGQEAVQLCNYRDVYYNEHITDELEFMPATATREQVRRFSLRAGDVLITKDSESWTDIAVSAVVAEDLPGVLCGYHLAQIRTVGDCQGAFLSRVFAAVGPRDQYQIAANGITRFGLGGDAIRNGVFAVPPESEQRATVRFLDAETARIDALVAKVRDGIERFNELRSALISAAVTGKIDVRDQAA